MCMRAVSESVEGYTNTTGGNGEIVQIGRYFNEHTKVTFKHKLYAIMKHNVSA